MQSVWFMKCFSNGFCSNHCLPLLQTALNLLCYLSLTRILDEARSSNGVCVFIAGLCCLTVVAVFSCVASICNVCTIEFTCAFASQTSQDLGFTPTKDSAKRRTWTGLLACTNQDNCCQQRLCGKRAWRCEILCFCVFLCEIQNR